MQKTKRFTKKEWSWIMYDWANSIYATNIMAAIYPTIFASTFPGGDIRWGYATSIATFIVAILAPFLGSIADHKGMKKKLFTVFALMGILFTPLMAAIGSWKLCLIGYVISHIGFAGSNLFYDSFLTDVTTDERMNRVSSWGFAMGYIGGSTIPFLISIAILLIFDYNPFAQVFSVLIVSGWWAVFSIPFMKNVKQEHYLADAGRITIQGIFKNVIKTFRDICTRKGLLIFIIAYFFYIDGVNTVITVSTAYGSTLGLGSTGMILALLVTQIVAMPCSILFAKLSDKTGARKALSGAVIMYIIICLVGFYMGFSMEPSQNVCKDIVKNTIAPYTANVTEEEQESFVNDAIGILRSENAQEEISGLNKLTGDDATEAEIRSLLLAAKENDPAAFTEYNSAISFSSILFWGMAILVGCVQGGIQAVSRSYFGKLVPKDRSNEFFGFFDIFGKFAAVIGPALYATVAKYTGRSSFGVLGIMLLFIIGIIVLTAGRKHLDNLTK